MPLQKNQLLTLRIERLSSDGSGVAHSADGEAVFVPNTAPGDEARIKIVKDCGRYAFGILDQLLTPSPDRVEVDCPAAGPCGGCSLRHLSYKAELQAKHENVTDAFATMAGWAYQGEQAFVWLVKKESFGMVYRVFFCFAASAGCVCVAEIVWNFAELANACMAVPNLICVLRLWKTVKEGAVRFESSIKKSEQRKNGGRGGT